MLHIAYNLHKQNLEMERDYFNKSSIDFSKFSQPAPDPQRSKIYTYTSQISPSAQITHLQTCFYRNKIFHSAHKYQVPIYDCPRGGQDNPAYQEFYKTHRKFVKPYGQLTKHTDTLNKNKILLRRCQFDLPITVDVTHHKPKSTNRLTKTRMTASRYEKHERLGVTTAAPNRTGFDRTVQNQYLVFKRLFDKERSGKSDKKELDNSINRLLAAQMINLQISQPGKIRSRTIEA